MPRFHEDLLFYDVFYIFYVNFVVSDAFIFNSRHWSDYGLWFSSLRVRFAEWAATWRVSRPLIFKNQTEWWECSDRLSNAHKSCGWSVTHTQQHSLFSGPLQSSWKHVFDKHGKMKFLSLFVKWTWAQVRVPVSCLFPPLLPQPPSFFLACCDPHEC